VLFGSCPSLVIVEDLQVLSPQREAPASEAQTKALARLSSLMDGLHQDPPAGHVVVMATTNQLERVEQSLRSPRRFAKEIEIPVPSTADRLEVRLSVLVPNGETVSRIHNFSYK